MKALQDIIQARQRSTLHERSTSGRNDGTPQTTYFDELGELKWSYNDYLPLTGLALQWYTPGRSCSTRRATEHEDQHIREVLETLRHDNTSSAAENEGFLAGLQELKRQHQALVDRAEALVATMCEGQGSVTRTYGDTTVMQGATAVLGDVVFNYVFGESNLHSTPQGQDAHEWLSPEDDTDRTEQSHPAMTAYPMPRTSGASSNRQSSATAPTPFTNHFDDLTRSQPQQFHPVVPRHHHSRSPTSASLVNRPPPPTVASRQVTQAHSTNDFPHQSTRPTHAAELASSSSLSPAPANVSSLDSHQPSGSHLTAVRRKPLNAAPPPYSEDSPQPVPAEKPAPAPSTELMDLNTWTPFPSNFAESLFWPSNNAETGPDWWSPGTARDTGDPSSNTGSLVDDETVGAKPGVSRNPFRRS